MANSPVIRITATGGGWAGAVVAHLLRHAHLGIHVSESAPESFERGAAAGLACSAQKALQQVVDLPEVVTILKTPGEVLQASTRLCIGPGTHAGTVSLDLGNDASDGTRGASRSPPP